MGATTPNKSLFVVGSPSKDSQNALLRQRWPKLFLALDCYPLHAFSVEGRRNVIRRHGISDEQLESVLVAYVHPDAPTEEQQAIDLAGLSGVVQAVVKPALKRNKAPKGNRGGGSKC